MSDQLRDLLDELVSSARCEMPADTHAVRDRVVALFSDIRSREETALKEVEFLCRQLDVLGYHKGANLSRARCGLPEVAHG
jgi:predicted Zn-dependent protease with MMP-like domain